MASTNNSYHNEIPDKGNGNASATSSLVLSSPNSTVSRTFTRHLPINRFPTEVLAMVFRTFTRVETCVLDPNDTVFRTIILGTVCSYWRTITINDSTFWTYIPIGNTMGSHRITSLCLERSQDMLVDISADLTGGISWPVEEALSLHAHRVRSLYILSSEIESIRLVMGRILSGGIPRSLKHLSIKNNLSAYRSGAGYDSIISQSLPGLRESLHELVKQLHTLRLRRVSLEPGSYSFDNIRDLSLESAYPADIVRALAPGNSVQSIEILYLLSEGGLNLSTGLPATVGSLERLFLGYIKDPAALCNLLGPIPPSSFEVDLTMHIGRAFLPQHDDTVSDSSPRVPRGVDMLGPLLHKFENLTTLGLRSNMFPPSSDLSNPVRTLLKHLPGLCYLDLRGFFLNQSMSAAMTRLYEQNLNLRSNTFPILRRLRLGGTHITDYDAFKAMIFSHQLSYLHISYCKLKWDGENPTTYPSSSSVLYKWLSDVVRNVLVE